MIVEDYFFLAPDWQYDMLLGRRWRTSTQLSLYKGEKRAKLVNYPAKVLTYSVVPFNANENSYVRRKLYRARDKKFGVPIWMDRCSTTMDVNPGTGTTFTVDDNTLRQFEVGGLLVLLDDHDNYEVKEISSIGSNQFTVDDDFVGSWSSGTYVYPVLQGRLSTSLTMSSYTTQGHSQLELEVVEDYDPDITRTVYSGSTFSSYLGYPIFNVEPEWSISPESKFEVYPEVTQFLAKSIDYAYAVEGRLFNRGNYIFYSRADAYEAIKFFDENAGRWGEFWYPSWQDDVVLTATFQSSDTVLSIEDIEWNDYWRHNKCTGRFLYVLLPDGTEIIRKILSAPSSTSLQVDSAMGTTITSLQKVICCFLLMGRFDHDELKMRWLSETVADSTMEFVTLTDAITVTTTTT